MTNEQRTRVAVVSPQPVVVAGITAVLGRHRGRIAMVPASMATAEAGPDVVLYDVLGLADGNIDELADLVDQAAAVLAIRRDQPGLLNQALARGADGCVDLSIGDQALLAALDAAKARKRSTTTPGPIVCACPTRPASRMGVAVGLSAQEAEILVAVAQGLSNAEIADRGFLSVNTVKTYIRSSYRKIGVRSRSQAVVWVLQHGFDAAADEAQAPAPSASVSAR